MTSDVLDKLRAQLYLRKVGARLSDSPVTKQDRIPSVRRLTVNFEFEPGTYQARVERHAMVATG